MRRQFERDQAANSVSEHDRVASERFDSLTCQRNQIDELKFAEWRSRALAECRAQIRHVNLPSNRREIAKHDRKMTRRGEEFGEQDYRSGKLERLGALASCGETAEISVHRYWRCYLREKSGCETHRGFHASSMVYARKMRHRRGKDCT